MSVRILLVFVSMAILLKTRVAGPNKLKLHYGDLSDSTNLVYIIAQVQPTEVYNLGAQSHVKVSFEMAEYTGDVDGLGTLRLLDAIRTCGLEKHVRVYQASTSELYGKVVRVETPQSKKMPLYLCSPVVCVPETYGSRVHTLARVSLSICVPWSLLAHTKRV